MANETGFIHCTHLRDVLSAARAHYEDLHPFEFEFDETKNGFTINWAGADSAHPIGEWRKTGDALGFFYGTDTHPRYRAVDVTEIHTSTDDVIRSCRIAHFSWSVPAICKSTG